MQTEPAVQLASVKLWPGAGTSSRNSSPHRGHAEMRKPASVQVAGFSCTISGVWGQVLEPAGAVVGELDWLGSVTLPSLPHAHSVSAMARARNMDIKRFIKYSLSFEKQSQTTL